MNRFSWLARFVMPSVVEGIGIGIDELKEITPDHFDKVLEWTKDNIFQELANIYTDTNENNKEQLKNWYKAKRVSFLYVALQAVVEEGKLLASDRLFEGSQAYVIVARQLEELKSSLEFLQSQIGDKEEMENLFISSIPSRVDEAKKKHGF